jgi:hypothetical protein
MWKSSGSRASPELRGARWSFLLTLRDRITGALCNDSTRRESRCEQWSRLRSSSARLHRDRYPANLRQDRSTDDDCQWNLRDGSPKHAATEADVAAVPRRTQQGCLNGLPRSYIDAGQRSVALVESPHWPCRITRSGNRRAREGLQNCRGGAGRPPRSSLADSTLSSRSRPSFAAGGA